ncbi:MAG TPA: (2Fe-2S)-binding protein [Hyphomicrobiales bacterium]|jgi:xanthine dehydrogenase YagT iron-sulfur-binding subunit
MADETPRQSLLNRRSFLAAAGASATIPLTARGAGAQQETAVAAPPAQPRDRINFTLRINGQDHLLALEPRVTLLDALRDHVHLTGTKKGCDHGQCGACTVHVDGKRVLSCMSFAVMNEGREITTIEGLAGPGGELHPMQQAFVDHDAFQCGYCTPGQIMSAIACVKEGHAGNEADIREYMSGNICRCAAYPNIVAAVMQARSEIKGA